MRSLELFAGTGALALAIENTLGATTDYVAEFDDAPSKVLAHRFPGTHNLRDVTTADWGSIGTIDVIGGGSPCQDISGAGRRAGMITGNRSGLWESYREAVAVLRPKFVVWENVRGALTSKASSATDPDGKAGNLRALGRVLGDLATLGYDAEWVMVKASDVGGCHQRARIFLLAWDRYTVSAVHPGVEPFAVWDEGADQFRTLADGLFAVFADTYRDKYPTTGAMRSGDLLPRHDAKPIHALIPGKYLPTPTASDRFGPGAHGEGGLDLRTTVATYLEGAGPMKLLPTPVVSDSFGGRNETANRKPGAKFSSGRTLCDFAYLYPDARSLKLLPTPTASDGKRTTVSVNAAMNHSATTLGMEVADVDLNGWGEYLPAVLRWAYTFGQGVPHPTEPGAKEGARPRLHAPFPEWMMGFQPGWVTDPELGIKRSDQLKMIGNSVMQQQAEHGINEVLARAGIAEVTSFDAGSVSHVA